MEFREVKTDILDEHKVLTPNKEGRFELFLVSMNNFTTASQASTMPLKSIQNQMSIRNRHHAPITRYDDSKKLYIFN